MKCCVDICRRPATVLVVFRYSPREYCYCGFHAIDRRGNLRWRPKQVAHATTMRGVR